MKRLLSCLLCLLLAVPALGALADDYSDLMEKAEAYRAAEDFDRAVACFQLAQRVTPENLESYLKEVEIHVSREDYQEAGQALSAALERYPLSAETWLLKCRMDALAKDLDAFEKDRLFAEVCGADFADGASLFAMLYVEDGQDDQALAYFSMADVSALNEEEARAYRRLLLAKGRREEADRLGLTASSKRNEGLDAAFQAGSLALTPVTLPAINAQDIDMPAAFWQEVGMADAENKEEMVAEAIRESGVSLLSVSPAGNSGLLMVGNGEVFLGQYNGKYHVLYPSKTRGAEDTYGNFERMMSRGLQRLLGREGLSYSPDGRYAALTNCDDVLMKGLYAYDPYLIDLSTGEIILMASYDSWMRNENSGVPTTGCFSEDGRYYYYMLYGYSNDYRTALYRYDLKKETAEFCFSGSDLTYYPCLSETAGGAFCILKDVFRGEENQGVYMMEEASGVWSGKNTDFDISYDAWYANTMLYSSNSGWAVVPGRERKNNTYFAFQRIRPDEECKGINEYVMLSQEDGQARVMNAQEAEEMMNGLWALENVTLSDLPYQCILYAKLSPDGHYLLLLTRTYSEGAENNQERHLLLLNLDDLTVKPVQGIDLDGIPATTNAASYKPVIEWNGDTLIIETAGGVGAYAFQ